MVNVERTDVFIRLFSKIKDFSLKTKVVKQIQKIIKEPEIGKPMRYARKGTREVYISPFRLSYSWNSTIKINNKPKLFFLLLNK